MLEVHKHEMYSRLAPRAAKFDLNGGAIIGSSDDPSLPNRPEQLSP